MYIKFGRVYYKHLRICLFSKISSDLLSTSHDFFTERSFRNSINIIFKIIGQFKYFAIHRVQRKHNFVSYLKSDFAVNKYEKNKNLIVLDDNSKQNFIYN